MSADLTPEQREEMRERHPRHSYGVPLVNVSGVSVCARCQVYWPCDAARLLDALDRAETETERLGGIVVDLEDSEVVPADDWAAEVERTREAERQRDDALAVLWEIEAHGCEGLLECSDPDEVTCRACLDYLTGRA